MNRFKKLFGSAAFLSIGLALTIMVSYMMRPLDESFHRDRFTGFYAEADDSLDIVGFGSSALYCFLNSPALYEYTGMTSYPLATAGQPFYTIEYLVDEALKTQSPQLLVVEARRFFSPLQEIKQNWLRIVTDNMNYSANRISLINERVGDWSDRLPFYFDIAMYHDNWENLSRDALAYIFNSRPNSLKGWEDNARHKKLKRPDISGVTEELSLGEENEELLMRLMRKCREKDLEVLFVLTPYRIDAESAKKANRMKRIVEEFGYRFLDCNRCVDEIGIDFSMDYFDKHHTNSIGADKFTKYLGDYIMENYDIDTDHSPEVAADWDRAAEENRANYKEASETIYQIARMKQEKENTQQ